MAVALAWENKQLVKSYGLDFIHVHVNVKKKKKKKKVIYLS